jgi:MoxR-like ATPase
VTTNARSAPESVATSSVCDGRRTWEAVRRAVSHAVVGAENALRLVLIAVLADGHALIEDVPGVGKTLLARATARALGLETARVQGTPDLLPADVTGASILEEGRFRFVPGPVFTNILLVDEINRATPRTQSALLEAMQERQVSALDLLAADYELARFGGSRLTPAEHRRALGRWRRLSQDRARGQ